MDLDEKKAEKRDTDNFKILRDDFVSGFRNFGCKAIEEIIAHEPALSEESRWWSDIKKYNSKNAPNSIIATDNRRSIPAALTRAALPSGCCTCIRMGR